MNRMQMINLLSATGGVTKKVAELQLSALLTGIKESLGAGEPVVVADNFSLYVAEKAARRGRNPRTGEPVDIPAKRVVKFKPHKQFREAV